jgi:hypothetical protein
VVDFFASTEKRDDVVKKTMRRAIVTAVLATAEVRNGG